MEDIANLAKDELLRLLKAQSENIVMKKRCDFRPLKGDREQCKEASSISYGDKSYCNKHKVTVQAKDARRVSDEKAAAEVERKAAESQTPVSASAAASNLARDHVSAESGHAPQPQGDEAHQTQTQQQAAPQQAQQPQAQLASDVKASVDGQSPSPEKAKEAPKMIPGPGRRILTIRKNRWDRYEEPTTHIIFYPVTKTAYGVQEPNGTVSSLSSYHIEICKRKGWPYVPLTSRPPQAKEPAPNKKDTTVPESDGDDSDETSAANDSEDEAANEAEASDDASNVEASEDGDAEDDADEDEEDADEDEDGEVDSDDEDSDDESASDSSSDSDSAS